MKILVALLACVTGSFAQTCASPTPIQITGPVNALAGPMTGTIGLSMTYTIPGNPPVVQSQRQVQVTRGIMYTNGVALVCMPAGAIVDASYVVNNPAPIVGTTRFSREWTIPESGGPYQVGAVESSDSTAPPTFSSAAPLTYSRTTGLLGIQQASPSQSGYLSAADYATFLAGATAIPAYPSTAGTYCLQVTMPAGGLTWKSCTPASLCLASLTNSEFLDLTNVELLDLTNSCSSGGSLTLLSLTNAQLSSLTNIQLASLTN